MLVSILLGQAAFYLSWIKNVSNTSIVPKNPLNFVLPSIQATPFKSQWPFAGSNSLAWLFGNAQLRVPRSKNANDLLSYVANSQQQSLNIFLGSGDFIKLAPSGTGYLFFVGGSNIVLSYTQAYYDTSSFGASGGSSGSGSSESGNDSGLGSSQGQRIALRQVSQALDPVKYTVVSMQSLASLITLRSVSGTRTLVSMWSDEYSQPTFGQFVMQPYLEFHNTFSITIGPLNSSFKVTTASNTYTVTMPFGGPYSPNDFIVMLQNSINLVYPILSVQLNAIDTNNSDYLQVCKLRWVNNSENCTIKVLDDSVPYSKASCATSATLGLFTINQNIANINPLQVTVTVPTYSQSPIVTQWPVGFPFQRYANPGSADTDGHLRIYSGTPVDAQLPEPALLIFTASNYTQVYYFSTSAVKSMGTQQLSDGSTKQVPLEITLRHTQNGQYITKIKIIDQSSEFLGHSSVTADAEEYFGPALSALAASESTGSQKITTSVVKDLSIVIKYYDDLSMSNVKTTITCNLVLEPFGYKTKIIPEEEDNYFTDPSQMFSVQAWAGGGGSILNTSLGSFYGGASSRVQLSFGGKPSKIECQVGLKGTRIDDNWCSGGGLTSLKLDNVDIFVIGGGGGAALGSHGGQGGGPIGDPLSASAEVTGNYIQYSGFSGSVDAFSIELLTQVLGPTAKPFMSPSSSSSSSATGDTEEIWQGSGGSEENGLNGFFNVASRASATGGSGSYDFGRTIFGGSGAFAMGLYGAGGGGPTVIKNYSTYDGFDISKISVNGPWIFDSGPLGGGFGPYYPEKENNFNPLSYYCDNTSIMELLANYLWSRAKQIDWTTTILQNLAKLLFLKGELSEIDSQNLFAVSDTFADVNNEGAISYVALGPHDDWLPSTGGPNVTVVGSNETVLSDGGQTICIQNDGQIPNFNDLPNYLNTNFSGEGVPDATTVISIRFGASVPEGVYSTCIYLGLSNVVESIGPFTWRIPSSGSFLNVPPVFSAGTLVKSEGLIPSSNQWDRTFIFSAVDPIDSQTLITDLYSTMTHTSFSENLRPPYKFFYCWPSDTDTGPSYFQDIWPVQTYPPGNNLLTNISNNLITLRVFLRPIALQRLTGPLSSTIIVNFNEDQEVYVPMKTQEIKFYAFGAGGSSVDGIYAGSDGQFASISYKSLAGQTLIAHIGQGGGTGAVQGSFGGQNMDGQVIGGGCTFVTTQDLKPLVYAAGGGSGGQRPSTEKYFEYSGPYTTTLNPGGGGYLWGASGSAGRAGTSGTSFAPGGLISKNIKKQKYYDSSIGFGSTTEAGNGKLVIEFTY